MLQGRHVLAVAGTHGKTTTTSMLAWILEHAGLEPGFLVGGVPLNFGVSARLGQGRAFVIEADEYDTAFFDKRSKFVHYRPRTAILNNLEFDHADIFDDLAAIERQFHHLVRTVPAAGRVVVNGLEESLARVLHTGCWSEVRTLRRGRAATSRARGRAARASTCSSAAEPSARVAWDLSGVHNQLNALAAIAAAAARGRGAGGRRAALGDFRNVKRRMEVRGDGAAASRSTTTSPTIPPRSAPPSTACAARWATQRILAVFEPRSNTMKLGTMKAQLPWSLEQADLAFCHGGGLGWDAGRSAGADGRRAAVAGTIDALVRAGRAAARPGDHVVCMSNGGFGGIHAKLLEALARQPRRRRALKTARMSAGAVRAGPAPSRPSERRLLSRESRSQASRRGAARLGASRQAAAAALDAVVVIAPA